VDLSAPKGKRKQFAISNIPIISKILVRNIFGSRRWINNDFKLIQNKFGDRKQIATSIDEGYEIIKYWINCHTNRRQNDGR